MIDKDFNKARMEATDAIVHWAKTGRGYYTMRNAVNRFIDESGANRHAIGGEETILAYRKIAVSRLAIDCIYALSKPELAKLDRKLDEIANDIPRESKGIRR